MSNLRKKTCVHSSGHSFEPEVVKLCQNGFPKNLEGLILGHVRSKTRSLCQILEKPCLTQEGTVLIQRS